MIASGLVQAHHLSRKAVIYIRQSTGHQVLTNLESQRMQRAMRDHAVNLGWPDNLIETVEVDTGVSGKSTVDRVGYRNLLSEVGQGLVGAVLSYESARLSRNCSDWYPLLDRCAFTDCLIGDRDGIYDPCCANGRLLLGMKGILSEVELHTLRGRLVAGSLNKARRGELRLNLPAGLVRLKGDRVVKDPDLRVQGAIDLVFSSFLKLRSSCQVARQLRREGLTLPRRHRNDETVWRPARAARVMAILKNPAYGGAFVYGKVHNEQCFEADGIHMKRRRVDMKEWAVIVKDRYPKYVSWDTFETIQAVLKENRAEYDRKMTRGVPRIGEALLQGIAYCSECGHKMKIQYQRHGRYRCDHLRESTGSVCQNLLAAPIDEAVTRAFFQALSPAELDLYDDAISQRQEMDSELRGAHERELQRLRYEADLSRRQYDRVDPDNRNVASELERRWEMALRALSEAEAQFNQATIKSQKIVDQKIPSDLRTALTSLGQSLPELWTKEIVTPKHRKALLRCLLDKVTLRREPNADHVIVRIVWRGGADTEMKVPVDVGSFERLPRFAEMKERLLELETQGKSDEEISETLTAEGYRSARDTRVLPATVRVLRLNERRVHRYRKSRNKRVPGFLTVPQLAKELGVRNEWFYHRIRSGAIEVSRDPDTGLYLFPDQPETLKRLRELQRGPTTTQ